MDVARFPALTYAGTCAAKGLGGDLAMHGVTRPFDLSLTWGGMPWSRKGGWFAPIGA